MSRKPKARYSWNRKHDRCGGTGWVTVMATSKIGGRPMVAVTRCDCWFRISPEPQQKKKHTKYTDHKSKAAGE